MSYAWDITIPADTQESSPKEQILQLHKGVITRIELKFAPGPHGLVKVRIFRWEFQLVPLNRDEWITGDDEIVRYDLYYPLTVEPYQLKFVGASPGTKYPHRITVRVNILPERIAYWWMILDKFVRTFGRIFGLK